MKSNHDQRPNRHRRNTQDRQTDIRTDGQTRETHRRKIARETERQTHRTDRTDMTDRTERTDR